MNRPLTKRLHAIAGALALVLILTFLSSTVVVELSGHAPAVAAVKRLIAYGLLLLVPSLALTGITGQRLAGRSRARAVEVKRKRMLFAAANGLLVLVPCAIALHILASAGAFGPTFYAVQAVELVAGPINVALIGLNIRDGLRLSGRLSRPKGS